VEGFGFLQPVCQGSPHEAGLGGFERVTGVAELAGGVEEPGVALAFHGTSFEVVAGAAGQALRLIRGLG
jgi:hypothetical protein